MQLSGVQDFQQIVYAYYDRHGRHDLPWRQTQADGNYSPYAIVVSELMLQQTQVSRVILKYQQFLDVFPDQVSLAEAPLGDVLRIWIGLGYNRRAKFLHQAAQMIQRDFQGVFPSTLAELTKLPGVGANTAGAIMAYAFNEAVPFVETNIRTVFIHHFFPEQSAVDDKQILAMAAQVLDRQNPRLWYWALMDYGAHLKLTAGNASRASKSYNRQSAFHGSRRQLRGQVIRLLTEQPLKLVDLQQMISDERLIVVLDALVQESLIQKRNDSFSL
jgi:A/G-specific adenine glycosylase